MTQFTTWKTYLDKSTKICPVQWQTGMGDARLRRRILPVQVKTAEWPNHAKLSDLTVRVLSSRHNTYCIWLSYRYDASCPFSAWHTSALRVPSVHNIPTACTHTHRTAPASGAAKPRANNRAIIEVKEPSRWTFWAFSTWYQ